MKKKVCFHVFVGCLISVVLVVLCWGCTARDEKEKTYASYDRVVDVRSKLESIDFGDILFGNYLHIYLMRDFVIVEDSYSPDVMLFVFRKKGFRYLFSAGRKGKGPGEITNGGGVVKDEKNGRFFLADYTKMQLNCFTLDSLLADPEHYLPYAFLHFPTEYQPTEFEYISDTLCYAEMICPIGTNNFKPVVTKWNMKTGDVKVVGYEHPMVGTKRAGDAISVEKNLYVEAHWSRDLISICTLDGELKCNIYGPGWDGGKVGKKDYYGRVVLCDRVFLVGYLGEWGFVKETNGRVRGKCASKILVFDYDGTYIKTLEVGREVTSMAYDEEDNRLYMSLIDPDMQFAYLDLEGLL